MNMNPPDTAPKDTQFLGHFGYPWLVMTRWNESFKQWTYANLQVGIYEGEWDDTYWETENEAESALIGWLPIPEIPQNP